MQNKWAINMNNNYLSIITTVIITMSFISAECIDDPNGTVATGNAGDCATLVGWVGCDGSMGPGNDADVDCPVTCGTCPPDCDNEGPTSHGCCLPDNNIYINQDGWVIYNTLEGIGGFQFMIEGATLNGDEAASGGDAGALGFTMNTNPENGMVLGFSVSGAIISEGGGCGTLCNIDIDGVVTGLADVDGTGAPATVFSDFSRK